MPGAEDHDEFVNYASRLPETEAEVACLARLANGGRVLELGIGTGRVAIPLAATGLGVHGIELDPEMIDQLRAKPGGDRVTVHHGGHGRRSCGWQLRADLRRVRHAVHAVDQAEQVRCFRRAAEKLTTGGKLVIEALMPRPASYDDRGGKVTVADANDERVILNVSQTDALTQTIHDRQVVLSAAGIEVHPVRIHYSWRSEPDLMAELAGLRPLERWSDWRGEPFTANHQRHVSNYERPVE